MTNASNKNKNELAVFSDALSEQNFRVETCVLQSISLAPIRLSGTCMHSIRIRIHIHIQ